MKKLQTEERNPRSTILDTAPINEIAELMNQEDAFVPEAIMAELPRIVSLIEVVVDRLEKGGRLFYAGAGTSGRLGVLDAAECVPTFNTSPEMVQGLIAGGEKALLKAVEGAEDSEELGEKDLEDRDLSEKDIVIGIAASGGTPYVIGALNYANKVGAQTGSIANNPNSPISKLANFPIEVLTGPEVLTGSTRLKAGTAQKLVLNMISTISMVRLGKVFENLMVDVQPTNKKLIERSKKIIIEATDCTYETAEKFFNRSEGSVKLAIIQILTDTSFEESKQLLKQNDGRVRRAIKSTNVS